MAGRDKGAFLHRVARCGDYAIRRGESERASDATHTQRGVVERAEEFDAGAAVHVERLRNTSVDRRACWRNS